VVTADVEQRMSDEPVRLACHAMAEHIAPSWRLLSLQPG
jgi:hypothetical protein